MKTPFVPFLLVGLGEAWLATILPTWAAWPMGWVAASTLWTALAYALNRPRMLGKKDAPAVAAVLLAPVLLFARGAAVLVRRHDQRELGPERGGERVEIVPGLWVGGWPRHGAPGLAQIDLTAELPRRGEAARYACIPMLDGAPMSEGRFRAAVKLALGWRAEGVPVLIHCAYGHGRSVAVLIGVLVAEGHFASWPAAFDHVRSLRPRARLTQAQRAVVEACVPPREAGATPLRMATLPA